MWLDRPKSVRGSCGFDPNRQKKDVAVLGLRYDDVDGCNDRNNRTHTLLHSCPSVSRPIALLSAMLAAVLCSVQIIESV
ncbi:hypothetical protein BDV38DRAFT_258325 [Aspergillus pseudotamarii]|uniref:Uncharacterized protein n=1 Tax=Aspergillus pseudotamarii TaxID=132259 RepID=A0A5N6SI26_ASPPS|nr:uncharacterized protein BDV38DRAFT_258325 [Aspergillus pseudotamarii]KAE8133390.1 hypothetical protein BDV38DRAFT_258325 [Aspergillus pseudotamarii]